MIRYSLRTQQEMRQAQRDEVRAVNEWVAEERREVQTRPQRELEARIAEGERRHKEIMANQLPAPPVTKERLKFWEAIKAQAEKDGIEFQMPAVEPAQEPVIEKRVVGRTTGPNIWGAPEMPSPEELRAKFEAVVKSGH